ncbi:MAG: methyl-accepting chemotaxis protein [Desulfobacteraceae bacterium]|nr:methyl-accepting chemotaxis protein [Desulfobacteraceae bacterium]
METTVSTSSLPTDPIKCPGDSKTTASPELVEKTLKALTDVATMVELLALNTEVEAARMGNRGKGFGDVAGEIRSLLNRTAETTFKIRNRGT